MSYIADDDGIGVFHRKMCNYAIQTVVINAISHYKQLQTA